MKTYTVRLEFDVVSTDFAELTVQASSPKEARELAKTKYLNDDYENLDFWVSDYMETTLANNSEDWETNETV